MKRHARVVLKVRWSRPASRPQQSVGVEVLGTDEIGVATGGHAHRRRVRDRQRLPSAPIGGSRRVSVKWKMRAVPIGATARLPGNAVVRGQVKECDIFHAIRQRLGTSTDGSAVVAGRWPWFVRDEV